MDSQEQLLLRLKDQEDQLVERKLEGAGSSEFKRQLVAFANSLPTSRTGVLFIGVANDGTIKGVENSDSLQKTIRHLAENECYPAIWADMNALTIEGGKILLAVSIAGSPRRPHFAGSAYIRRGSETIRASDSEYETLILSRDDKRRTLLEMMRKPCTFIAVGKHFGQPYPMGPNFSDKREGTVEEVTAFYVRFQAYGSGAYFTETLDSIDISYDDMQQRPLLMIHLPARHHW